MTSKAKRATASYYGSEKLHINMSFRGSKLVDTHTIKKQN